MPKPLLQRVDDAFTDDGRTPDQIRSDAIDYLKDFRPAWRDVAAALNRTVLLMFVGAAVFELFKTGKAVKMSIAGIEFQNLTPVQAVLPAVIAYQYLELMLLFLRYSNMQHMQTRLMQIAYPQAESNDLELWLTPPSLALLSPFSGRHLDIASREELVTEKVLTYIGYCSIFLPLIFEGYAFCVLFGNGSYIAWVWTSLVVTVALIMASLTILSVPGPEAVPEN
jgi:hypothetical protein